MTSRSRDGRRGCTYAHLASFPPSFFSSPPPSCAHPVREESGGLSYLWHPPIPHGNRDMHVIRMYLIVHHLIVHHLDEGI